MSINIGLFGGSFNPITNSHVKLSKKILNSNINLKEIWFMPSNSNDKKFLIDSYHRINMIKIAIQNIDKLKIFDFEIINKLPCNTLNTIKLLNKTEIIKKYKFYFIIGLDVANNLIKWKNYKELINIIDFIVIPRIGYEIKNDWFLKNNHLFLNNIIIEELSSTLFRKLYIKNKYHKNNLEKIINKNVLKYILNNDLY
jgi:nicotinate-nucleotide adenylyltransferase